MKEGFNIIHPEELSIDSQIDIATNATHIAGLTGSQLHLAIFNARPELRFLKISSYGFNTPIDKKIVKYIGGHYCDIAIGKSDMKSNKGNWYISDHDLIELELYIRKWCAGDI